MPGYTEEDHGEFEISKLSHEQIKSNVNAAENRNLWHLKNTKIYTAQDYIREKLQAKGIDAEEAGRISRGQGANVVVINSGVDYCHAELSDRFTLFKGNDCTEPDKEPIDEQGHGTSMASIIAGSLIGVANQATLYSVKIGDKNDFRSSNLHDAIIWCIKHKDTFDLDILNLSLSMHYYDKTLESLCNEANENGLLVVAAAGNVCQGITFPSAFQNVLSVGAIDQHSVRYEKSAIAPTVNIVAPGKAIFSAIPSEDSGNYDDAYALVTGTSAAVAVVSGTLALGIAYLKRCGKRNQIPYLRTIIMETTQLPSDNVGVLADAQRVIYNYQLQLYNPNLNVQRVLPWIYGNGVLQADRFIKELDS